MKVGYHIFTGKKNRLEKHIYLINFYICMCVDTEKV